MLDDANKEDHVVHTFKNHLAIIIGFSDLLLSEMSADDPRRKDVAEINKAGRDALAALQDLARHLSS